MGNGKIETCGMVSAFIRRESEIIFAEDMSTKHKNLVKDLAGKHNEDWETDIKNKPEKRKKWDMGLFLRKRSGEIKIGGYSASFNFPEDSEMPEVRGVTMELLEKQYPEEIFIEATEIESERLIEARIKILESQAF